MKYISTLERDKQFAIFLQLIWHKSLFLNQKLKMLTNMERWKI